MTPEEQPRVAETDLTPEQISAWKESVKAHGPTILAMLQRAREAKESDASAGEEAAPDPPVKPKVT